MHRYALIAGYIPDVAPASEPTKRKVGDVVDVPVHASAAGPVSLGLQFRWLAAAETALVPGAVD